MRDTSEFGASLSSPDSKAPSGCLPAQSSPLTLIKTNSEQLLPSATAQFQSYAGIRIRVNVRILQIHFGLTGEGEEEAVLLVGGIQLLRSFLLNLSTYICNVDYVESHRYSYIT